MQESSEQFLKLAVRAAKEAAKIILARRGKAKIVEWKEDYDFAVDVDHKSENKIITVIKKSYPDHNILAEETGKINKGSEYTWVIDPIDGTLNFTHGLPLFTVAIGLLKGNEPLVGVVYAPVLREFFHAIKGKGAFLNGKRIHVSNTAEVEKSLFAANALHFCNAGFSRHLARALGASSLELAYVACGRFGGRIKLRGTDPYGYAAGSILITEAGGKITGMRNQPWNIKTDGALASNGKLHQKLLDLFGPLV